ncbi:type III secretion chaperone [Shewanella violacea]|uniref:Type III secretion chaperone, putative n=1 Tax=Shewanella violacea (strain JCM 10179 / CIP 106290 / LMG 19151 / DSS12) TaxID=637905 RepID=D4ZKM0_SHEVD|nr:type III secretion chaperone [Shewanella violacea]BAJ02219.1 type III secretion chaperone, putative [Shewanella violacea DSS12]
MEASLIDQHLYYEDLKEPLEQLLTGKKTLEQMDENIGKELAGWLDRMLNKHITLAEVAGITEQELEDTYALGLEKYNAGLPEEALEYFSTLLVAQPMVARNHMALASTYHWLNECENALTFYYFAFSLDGFNPGITFRMAQCLIHLSDEMYAMEILRISIKQSYSDTKYREIGLMADKLLASMT